MAPIHRRAACAPARLLVVFVLFLVATPSIANAADPSWDGLRGHIRTTDDRLRRLLDVGMRSSQTFRALVHRLLESDVVVYLWCNGTKAAGVDGRLTFLSAAGGVRYVVVQLVRLQPRERQIAIIAHELQHAVEIANAPAVVDAPSLAREYRRIGYVSGDALSVHVTFDTDAAVTAGVTVLRELSSSSEY
jgi:hypothetical protein